MPEIETAGNGLDDGGDESHLAQILLARRMRRRRKLAGLALAHRILESESAEDEGEEDEGEDEGGEEHRLARLILAGGLARRRRRRRLAGLALARKIRSRDEDDEMEGEDDEEGGEEHRLARLILAGGLARRRRRRLAGLPQSELMWGPYRSLSNAFLQTHRNYSAFAQINRRLVAAFLGIARREQESADEIFESAIAGIHDFGQSLIDAQVHSIEEFRKHAREAVSSGERSVRNAEAAQ
jgi:hypothetical protein